MIVKIGRQWYLFSRKRRVLGMHKTKAKAEAQERAINISKARAAGHHIPKKRSR